MLVLLIAGADILEAYEEQCRKGKYPDLEAFMLDFGLRKYCDDDWTK